MNYRLGAALAALLVTAPARAQMPPDGQPVLDQAVSIVALAANDTATFLPTRGLHVGDGSACDIKVTFANDSAAVVLTNLQPGGAYPYSIKQFYATGGTSCTAILALY